jgi:hypothetical protein
MTGPSEAEPRPMPRQSQNHENAIPPMGGTPPKADDFAPGSNAETSGDGVQRAGDQVWTVAEKARDQLAKNAEPAKRFVDEQKAAGARKIGDIAQVIHGAAGQLEPELPRVAKSVHEAAGFVEEAATALRERSVEDLVASCTKLARSQPAAFFAAAAFTGFIAARFIKSSADRSSAEPAGGNPTR